MPLSRSRLPAQNAYARPAAAVDKADRESPDCRHRDSRPLARAARCERAAAEDVASLGITGVVCALSVGAIAIGEGLREATGTSKLLDAALVATEAQLLTAAFTEGIAYGTGRARPGQSNDPGQWFSKWGR